MEMESFSNPNEIPGAVERRALNYFLEEATLAGWDVIPLENKEREEIGYKFMAQVIRNVLGEEAYHAYLAGEDASVQKAMGLLKNVSHLIVVNGRLTLPPNSILLNENI
jgi:hypothetical protein